MKSCTASFILNSYPIQEITLFFNIAWIYDTNFDDKKQAIPYYEKYRDRLTLHLESLRSENKEPDIILNIEERLEELERYIGRLKKL